MTPLVTPSDGKPYATVRQVLTGVEFVIEWSYNTRVDAWHIHLFRPVPGTTELEAVLVGALLSMGHDLLSRCQHPRRPEGSLYVVAASGIVRDLTLRDIWDKVVRVVYAEPGEIAA